MNWGCSSVSSNREAWPAGSLRADSMCVRARIAWLDSLQSSTCRASWHGELKHACGTALMSFRPKTWSRLAHS